MLVINFEQRSLKSFYNFHILCSVNVYAADLNLALYTSETLEEAFLDENIQGYDLTNYNQNDTNRVPVLNLSPCVGNKFWAT